MTGFKALVEASLRRSDFHRTLSCIFSFAFTYKPLHPKLQTKHTLLGLLLLSITWNRLLCFVSTFQAKVNRSKGNKTDISRSELIQRSSYCRVAGRDMDLIELTAYGNVQRAPTSSGCRIQ
jgi:hypothetical protein